MFEFDTSRFGCEVPVGFGLVAVTVALLRCDFCEESLAVGNTAVETLRGQSIEFGFRQIKPTAVSPGCDAIRSVPPGGGLPAPEKVS